MRHCVNWTFWDTMYDVWRLCAARAALNRLALLAQLFSSISCPSDYANHPSLTCGVLHISLYATCAIHVLCSQLHLSIKCLSHYANHLSLMHCVAYRLWCICMCACEMHEHDRVLRFFGYGMRNETLQGLFVQMANARCPWYYNSYNYNNSNYCCYY